MDGHTAHSAGLARGLGCFDFGGNHGRAGSAGDVGASGGAAGGAGARDASLYLAGCRTGAWIFKRDFSLGAKLALGDAIKRIALPALRVLVTVEQHERQLHIRNCPLCQPGSPSGGRFFAGFIEGLLIESTDTPGICVRETHCYSLGAPVCVFEVSH
jgi:hypothetical protein